MWIKSLAFISHPNIRRISNSSNVHSVIDTAPARSGTFIRSRFSSIFVSVNDKYSANPTLIPLARSLARSDPHQKSLLLLFPFFLLQQEEPFGPALKASLLGSCEKRGNMNRCAYEKNTMAGCEGMKMVDSVVCPKPRRLSLLNPSLNDPIRPFRYFNHNQLEIGDSQAESELLDIIRRKGYSGERPSYQVASSPPFFSGSPPSRASNPVVQDEQFGNSKMGPFSPAPPSRIGGGCVRMKSGDKPVAVRIEGFDCLSRDRRNCSISAVA